MKQLILMRFIGVLAGVVLIFSGCAWDGSGDPPEESVFFTTSGNAIALDLMPVYGGPIRVFCDLNISFMNFGSDAISDLSIGPVEIYDSITRACVGTFLITSEWDGCLSGFEKKSVLFSSVPLSSNISADLCDQKVYLKLTLIHQAVQPIRSFESSEIVVQCIY